MADKRISELSAADALDGSEKIPLEQGGVTKQIDSGTYALAVTRHLVPLRAWEIMRGDAVQETYTSPVNSNLDRPSIRCPSSSNINQPAVEFVPSRDMSSVKLLWHWVNPSSNTGDVSFRSRKADNMADSQGDDFNNESQSSDLISGGELTVTDPGQHIRQVGETGSFSVTAGVPFYIWLRVDPTNLGADVHLLHTEIVEA